MDDNRKTCDIADNCEQSLREYIDKAIFEAMSPTTPCIICEEDVPLTFDAFIGGSMSAKVCEKCKAAVLAVRQNMESVAEQRAILD